MIGTMFIELARQDTMRHQSNLPDRDLAYFEEGSRCFGEEVYVTRKGARSHIVRGKGHADSFESCSHGAGRVMSRGEAKRRFALADHRAATWSTWRTR